mgnify:CR=1 FL=1
MMLRMLKWIRHRAFVATMLGGAGLAHAVFGCYPSRGYGVIVDPYYYGWETVYVVDGCCGGWGFDFDWEDFWDDLFDD